MSPDSDFWLYETFNRSEAVAWFLVAILLPLRLRPVTRRLRVILVVACLTFVVFGITDLLEAPLHADLPLWLWLTKIGCGLTLLACRFAYIGWDKFRFSDRSMHVGLLCLVGALIAMNLPKLMQFIIEKQL